MKNHQSRLFDFSFIVAFAIALIFLLTSIVTAAMPIDEDDYVHVEVRTGDTLWGLAVQYEDFHGMSKNHFIEWVVDQNGMIGKELYPGDVILIPVKKEAEVAMVQ